MSTYTKHHRKYLETHKDRINSHRRKRYFNRQYGIPIEKYEEFISDFNTNRLDYIRFSKLIQKLNPELVQLIIEHYK